MADSRARLTILNGPLAGRELILEEIVDNILIGSDGACRFHLPTPGISPIHARLWMDASGVTVYDTHSPRGLYVNDDRVNGQAPLRNGDVLWLGTPGDEEAVMIQVRLPPRGRAASPTEPTAVAETSPEAEATVLMGGPPAAARADAEAAESTVMMPSAEPVVEAEMLEVVEEPATVSMPAPGLDAFTIAEPEEAESTLMMAAAPESEEPESDATFVDYAPPAAAIPEAIEADEAYAMPVPADEPVKFAIDLPRTEAVEPPPSFEDETSEPAEAAPAYEPPPAPPSVIAPPPPPVAARPVPAPSRPPRPAAAPAAPPPRPAAPSNVGRFAALGIVGVLIAGGGYAAWRTLRSPAPPPATTTTAPEPSLAAAATPAPVSPAPATEPPATKAPATVEAVPEPVVEEVVTIVKSPPPTALVAAAARPVAATPAAGVAKPTAAPPPSTVSPAIAQAQQAAAHVASLLGRAEAMASARDYSGAATVYDDVLKLDPANAKAGDGKAAALAAVASLKKGFVAGRTSVQSGKAAKGGLSGFDSEDVSVAKAPDYSGRIDFEVSPRNVKGGDSYTILAYLTNDGKKAFKVQSATVNTTVNGARNAVPASPRDKDLEPQQRVLLVEMPGTWQAETKTWSLEVAVTSTRNDTFRNQLSWR